MLKKSSKKNKSKNQKDDIFYRILVFLLKLVSGVLFFFLVIYLLQIGPVQSFVQEGMTSIYDMLGIPYQQYSPNFTMPQPKPRPVVEGTELEQEIHILVNKERTEHGISTLEWDGALTEIARQHSRDMAARDFFAHINPDNCSPDCRAEQAGYQCRKEVKDGLWTEGISENLFKNALYASIIKYEINGNEKVTVYNWTTQEEIAQSTVQGWMESPGHRRNILNNNLSSEGIGVYITPDYVVYITEDFC